MVLTCDNTHSWQLYSVASLRHQAADTMPCYPTRSHYPVIEPTSHCPILIMLSNNVIGLTQPEFKPTGSKFEHTRFRLSDLSDREAEALRIWPPQLVGRWWSTNGALECIERDASPHVFHSSANILTICLSSLLPITYFCRFVYVTFQVSEPDYSCASVISRRAS